MPDLLAGRIQLTFATLPSSIGHVRTGKLKAIAVATTRRSPGVPDVPTIAESGLPGYDADNWIGFVVPAGTPHAAIDRIWRDTRTQMELADFRQQLVATGFDPVVEGPEAFGRMLRNDLVKWRKVVVSSGAKPD